MIMKINKGIVPVQNLLSCFYFRQKGATIGKMQNKVYNKEN